MYVIGKLFCGIKASTSARNKLQKVAPSPAKKKISLHFAQWSEVCLNGPSFKQVDLGGLPIILLLSALMQTNLKNVTTYDSKN